MEEKKMEIRISEMPNGVKEGGGGEKLGKATGGLAWYATNAL